VIWCRNLWRLGAFFYSLIISWIETKIESLGESNPSKLEKIHTKLSLVIPKFKQSSKEYYILNSINSLVESALWMSQEITDQYSLIKVIDWDTIKVKVWEDIETIRLLWIDAPEVSDPFWKESKQHLESLIAWKDISLSDDNKNWSISDDYWRKVVYILIWDKNINLQMIEDWYAVELTYRENYSLQQDFKKAQEKAEALQIWMRENKLECWFKRYCNQMNSCEEAMFYLNECNVYSLDADWDGIPCESICW